MLTAAGRQSTPVHGGFMNATRRAACLMLMGLLTACASSPPAHGSWVLLGERDVDFKVDHDSIDVGRHEGRFRVLRFVAHGGEVEMYEIKIVLDDGEAFRHPTHLILDRGEGRTVDLPGDRRAVRRVEFVYRSLHKGDGHHATISLYGR